VQSGSSRIVLMDGETLTDLMVRFNVGVRAAQTVEIKRVQTDYFEEVETE
jgi:restriction system protein